MGVHVVAEKESAGVGMEGTERCLYEQKRVGA